MRGLSFADAERALTPQVQGHGGDLGGDDVHAIAARGTAGQGGALPHGDANQKAFGRHDVGAVQAHVGGAAADATGALGTTAYASGQQSPSAPRRTCTRRPTRRPTSCSSAAG